MNIIKIDCGLMSNRKCEKYLNGYVNKIHRDRVISELGLTGWKRVLYKIKYYLATEL